jgi:putative hemolysin
MFIYKLAVILFMLVLNAIFAAYEMGLASISRARLAVLLNDKKKGSTDAVFMKDRMEASLAIIQLGITIVGVIAAATGGAGVYETFTPSLQHRWGISPTLSGMLAIVILVIPLTFVMIVFAELVPKMIALNNKEWVVLHLSPFMKVLSQITHPVVSVIEATVKSVIEILPRKTRAEAGARGQWLHELKAAISLARTMKLLGEREEKIVLAAAHLSTHLVRDIIIPAQDISMIYIGSSLMDALVQAHLDMHTRFPICMKENDPQSIEGYVNFKDIVAALRVNPSDPTIRGISRPIQKIQDETPLSSLLEMMILQKIHIVIVVSKEGTVLGMITLEDIIEELVGEIEDEFDRLPSHIQACGWGWIIGGGAPMNTVAATAGLDWSDKFGSGRIPTLAEWSVQQAGMGIRGGEVFESWGLRVVPRKFRRKKILEAAVTIAGKPAVLDDCEGRNMEPRT